MRRRWSQHFLLDRNIARKIVSGLELSAGNHTVLEIGPGKGFLTQFLVQEARRVVAVEIDRRLSEELRAGFAGQKNIKIVTGDILRFDLSPFRNLKIVGNIPYAITSPLLMHLLRYRNWELAVVMMQREVGERLRASHGSKLYSPLSIKVQYHCKVERLHKVSPGVFYPRPEVDSLIIRLRRRHKPPIKVNNEEEFFKLVRTSFQGRRKMIGNTLTEFLKTDKQTMYQRAGEQALLLTRRAEELSMDEFACLARRLL